MTTKYIHITTDGSKRITFPSDVSTYDLLAVGAGAAGGDSRAGGGSAGGVKKRLTIPTTGDSTISTLIGRKGIGGGNLTTKRGGDTHVLSMELVVPGGAPGGSSGSHGEDGPSGGGAGSDDNSRNGGSNIEGLGYPGGNMPGSPSGRRCTGGGGGFGGPGGDGYYDEELEVPVSGDGGLGVDASDWGLGVIAAGGGGGVWEIGIPGTSNGGGNGGDDGDGHDATTYGSGGGGGGASGDGGAGYDGIVAIRYTTDTDEEAVVEDIIDTDVSYAAANLTGLSDYPKTNVTGSSAQIVGQSTYPKTNVSYSHVRVVGRSKKPLTYARTAKGYSLGKVESDLSGQEFVVRRELTWTLRGFGLDKILYIALYRDGEPIKNIEGRTPYTYLPHNATHYVDKTDPGDYHYALGLAFYKEVFDRREKVEPVQLSGEGEEVRKGETGEVRILQTSRPKTMVYGGRLRPSTQYEYDTHLLGVVPSEEAITNESLITQCDLVPGNDTVLENKPKWYRFTMNGKEAFYPTRSILLSGDNADDFRNKGLVDGTLTVTAANGKEYRVCLPWCTATKSTTLAYSESTAIAIIDPQLPRSQLGSILNCFTRYSQGGRLNMAKEDVPFALFSTHHVPVRERRETSDRVALYLPAPVRDHISWSNWYRWGPNINLEWYPLLIEV